jgi:hypothetical protein
LVLHFSGCFFWPHPKGEEGCQLHFFTQCFNFTDELIIDNIPEGKKYFQNIVSSIPIDSMFVCLEVIIFNSVDCHFVSESYKKHHLLSPVIMILGNFESLSATSIRSPELLIRISFCTGVSIRDYQMLPEAAHIQHIMKNTLATLTEI